MSGANVSPVFMFAGQGSQYFGMGRHLFDGDETFRRALQHYDRTFTDHGLPSVIEQVYRSDRSASTPMTDILVSHAAIVAIELALVRLLEHHGVVPSVIIGASLGEYAAAVAADVLDINTIARCIYRQTELVRHSRDDGRMMAVVGDLSLLNIEGSDVEVAAENSDSNVVLAGSRVEIERVKGLLRGTGLSAVVLDVEYAFHSRLMDPLESAYLEMLGTLQLGQPRCTYVSSVSGQVEAHLAASHFWDVVRKPIRFAAAVRTAAQVVEKPLFVDLSPSGTLANFVRQIIPSPDVAVETILNPLRAPDRSFEVIEDLKRARSSRTPTERPASTSPTHIDSERQMTVGQQDTSLKRALIFPGQGAQRIGMGSEVFDLFPDTVDQVSHRLGYSLRELCASDAQQQLSDTRFTQPALFVVGCLEYERFRQENGDSAQYLAGHSLGEYCALYAAQVFDLFSGLDIVAKRAQLMSGMGDGFMAAILGTGSEEVQSILERAGALDIDIANLNADLQTVIAGPASRSQDIQQAFTDAKVEAYIPLRVSGAFHSRYMHAAANEFAIFLRGFHFAEPQTPIVANTTARLYGDGSSAGSAEQLADEIRSTLVAQLVSPVRWADSVRFMANQGVTDFLELGPGNVLTRLLDQIDLSDSIPPATAPQNSVPPTEVVSPGIDLRSDGGLAPAVISVSNGRGAVAATGLAELGSAEFREAYGTKYAYACGAMYRGIASEELVVRAARNGILAYYGAGGLPAQVVGPAIERILAEVGQNAPVGVNIVHDTMSPDNEVELVQTLVRLGVRSADASAFMRVSEALVLYRLAGLSRTADGGVVARNRLMAKVSRPEVARGFLSPPPEELVEKLVANGLVSADQAEMGRRVPMVDDLCVEADSGGHTDRREALVLVPSFKRIRDQIRNETGLEQVVRVGAAGGIGSPEAAAAAFVLGADFIVTGSINLCTVESGMSAEVKDMIQSIGVQDTDYAPAGDMFELGAQIQVVKKGTLFAARAKKLYELYRRFDSIDDIDAPTIEQLETRYFGRSLDQVWDETKRYLAEQNPSLIAKAESDPKIKMAMVFRWYFGYSQRLAMDGDSQGKLDYQIHCGPALGAFNEWVRGTRMESWRDRHVDEIADAIMAGAAAQMQSVISGSPVDGPLVEVSA